MSSDSQNRFFEWLSARVAASGSVDANLLFTLIRRYFRRFRVKFLIIAVMIVIISVTSGAIALIVKEFVNKIFIDKNEYFFIKLFLFIILIFFAKGFATYFQSVLGARISNEIVADVQKRLYAHVVRQRMEFFNSYSSDDLQMRFSQGAGAFGSILTTVLVNATRDLAMVVALVAVMISQDPVLSLGCLVVAPVIFYGVLILLKRIKGLAEQEMERVAELYKRVRETAQGITIIKSYSLEQPASEATFAVIDVVRARADRIAMLQTAALPLLDVMGGIAVGIAVLYAGLRTISGGYDAGTFMAFLTALLLAADPARRLSQMRVDLRNSFALVNLVFDVLNDDQLEPQGNAVPAITDTTSGIGTSRRPPAIEFQHVGFSYGDQSPVLSDFDLRIESGKTMALVGPSGAGKSTVFKLLLKLYEPTSGQIVFDGINLADMNLNALRGAIGYVGQSNYIFNGSIRENISLMDENVSLEQVKQACVEVGLDQHISALADGYDTNVGELGGLISGGQAQRLNIVRALVKNAPVLLLDEVTSSLDAESEDRIRDVIRRMARQTTILMIAHRLSTVKDADRIALVKDGRIIDVGCHDELAVKNDYYKKIIALQFA